MARVRILHMHSSYNLGGQEARAVQLMNHFGDEAQHVVLSAVPDALGARDAIAPGIKAEFPGAAAPSLAGMPALGRYRELARYMQQFDLLLSYNWGSMDGVMARALMGMFSKLPPLIHHEDGFNEDEIDGLKAKRNWFRTIALRGSHAMAVPSMTLAAIAKRMWHRPETAIHRIPNGIDIPRYRNAPDPAAFPGFSKSENDVVVGTIAGLRPVKNLPRLVRAVAAAGPNVKLAIAGAGPERGAIMAEAERLGIASRVMMPGFLKDPARYVGLFDIFALSSDSEQFPISLVEAMAAGKPIVSTDVGDVRNMVSGANLTYIIPRADEDALANAIRSLAANKKLRDHVGEENAHIAHAEYDQERMFARYRQLYGSAMRRTDFARQA